MNFETNLQDLSDREDLELNKVRSLEGSIENKSTQVLTLGVDKSYAQIFLEYASLANSGSQEALKRAIFLQWFSIVEPLFLTGIGKLDEASITSTFQLLEKAVIQGQLDEELQWMLPYYFVIAEWFIPSRKKRFLRKEVSIFPALQRFCRENAPQEVVRPPNMAALKSRGQMGDYWMSISQ